MGADVEELMLMEAIRRSLIDSETTANPTGTISPTQPTSPTSTTQSGDLNRANSTSSNPTSPVASTMPVGTNITQLIPEQGPVNNSTLEVDEQSSSGNKELLSSVKSVQQEPASPSITEVETESKIPSPGAQKVEESES